jgi:hypothetical protein
MDTDTLIESDLYDNNVERHFDYEQPREYEPVETTPEHTNGNEAIENRDPTLQDLLDHTGGYEQDWKLEYSGK